MALPLRDRLKQRLTELWDYQRTSLPIVENGRLFYAKNTGLQRQSPIYVRAGFFDAPSLVIDPNLLSPDGSISLAQYMPSPDAQLLAYAIAEGGADWETVRIRNVATGEDLADTIAWVRFSDLSWTHDSAGFFYSRYPEPPAGKVLEAALSGQAVYYHRVGTPQSDDVLIYQRQDHPTWIVNATVSDDGRCVFIRTFRGADNNNQLHVIDLGSPASPSDHRADQADRGNARRRIHADWQLSHARVSAIRQGRAQPAHHRDRSGEPRAVGLEGRGAGAAARDRERRARRRAHRDSFARRRAEQDSAVQRSTARCQDDIPLPGVGAVSDLYGRSDQYDVWFSFSSPLSPATVYRYDVESRSRMAFEAPRPPIDASLFETRALFATSKDGTRVPFFLTSRKGLPRTAATRRCSTAMAASRSACCPPIAPTCRRGSSSAACS